MTATSNDDSSEVDGVQAAEEPANEPAGSGDGRTHQAAGSAPPAAASDDVAQAEGKGLELMMDIPLEVTVELGQTTLTLAEVLALGPGSVIELNRLPGEPLELLANGRLIARGEVVVLNESFGLRITEIVQDGKSQAGG